MTRRHLTALALALAFTGAATAAGAHAKLVSSTPSPHGVIHVGARNLELHFSEAVAPKLSGVAVKAADGRALPADLNVAKGGKAVAVVLKQPLAPGAYTVDWHAVASDDGHRTAGVFPFTAR